VESLKFKVDSLKLSEVVHWKGAVYGDEKFQLLAAHDLLVLPSFNENFANVVIESIAVGTPVLISDQVGLHQYVSRHHLGLVHQLTRESLLHQLDLFKEIAPLDFSIPKDFSSLPLVEKYMNLYHA
jgi:glycosyltransferase involved in cell wall biosynthesis